MDPVIPPRRHLFSKAALGSFQDPLALLRVDRKERRGLEMDAPRFLVMTKPIAFATLLCDLP